MKKINYSTVYVRTLVASIELSTEVAKEANIIVVDKWDDDNNNAILGHSNKVTYNILNDVNTILNDIKDANNIIEKRFDYKGDEESYYCQYNSDKAFIEIIKEKNVVIKIYRLSDKLIRTESIEYDNINI